MPILVLNADGDEVEVLSPADFLSTTPTPASNMQAVRLHATDGTLLTPSVATLDDFMNQGSTLISVMPEVDETPDYADGDCVGGLMTFTNFARDEGGKGTLFYLNVKSKVAISAPLFVHIFSDNPSASTFTDNAVAVLHATDWTKVIDTISISASDWKPIGVAGHQARMRLGIPYQLSGSLRSLYLAIEADGVVALGSSSDLVIRLGGNND